MEFLRVLFECNALVFEVLFVVAMLMHAYDFNYKVSMFMSYMTLAAGIILFIFLLVLIFLSVAQNSGLLMR